MSSSSGFPLSGQRPQLISRFEVPQANQVAKVGQAAEPERTVGTAVQGVSTQVAQKIFEAQRLNFPSESPIGRFRGDVTGRGVNEVSGGQGISRLPKQVRPFDPSDPSGVISSLNPAERAAIGAAPRETWEDVPGGGTRIVQRALGVEAVWVNGVRLVDSGRTSDARPGRILRRREEAKKSRPVDTTDARRASSQPSRSRAKDRTN